MNKKLLSIMAATGVAAAGLGINPNRLMRSYTHPRETTKESLSREEQDNKIFKAEEKRLTKALKKKLITQEEFNVRLILAKQKLNKEETTKDHGKD